MASEQSLPGGGVALPPTEEALQSAFDNGIWYALSLWPVLHVAVTNGWGGPDSADKKDWFAGAVSELFTSRPDTDQDDLEIFLLQILQDEFDVNVEDESEVEVARTIIGLKKTLAEQDLSFAQDLERRFRNKGKMKVDIRVEEREEEVDDEEWDGLDDDGDMDMDAPPLVPAKPKEKIVPEVDEDGFTKVVGKKKK